jgi:hypothetical protein
MHAALLVILQFDMAQETRALSANERDLRARLKRRVIDLAVVERARKKQCARITSIKEGYANTKFSHLRMNARRRKTHIHRLKHNQGWVTEHGAKEQIIHNHFQEATGTRKTRSQDFNWEEINFVETDLHSLGEPFTEEEAKHAINLMPNDKAPEPDGYTGIFFKRYWDIMKFDIMNVVNLFGNLYYENFHWLNSTNIALIPKKDGAEVSDFRPISLILMPLRESLQRC